MYRHGRSHSSWIIKWTLNRVCLAESMFSVCQSKTTDSLSQVVFSHTLILNMFLQNISKAFHKMFTEPFNSKSHAFLLQWKTFLYYFYQLTLIPSALDHLDWVSMNLLFSFIFAICLYSYILKEFLNFIIQTFFWIFALVINFFFYFQNIFLSGWSFFIVSFLK